MKSDKTVVSIARIVVLILVLVALLFGALTQIGKEFMKKESATYPQSTLTDNPVAFMEEYVQQEGLLDYRVGCPSLPYAISVPKEVYVEGDTIHATLGDIDILICESAESFDFMLTKTLPTKLNFPLLGNPHDVSVLVRDMGYFYAYGADYAAGRINTKISVREVVTYICMYRLALSEVNSLYIYVSSESEELLSGQKDLLESIAFSVRAIDENATVEEEILADEVIEPIVEEDAVEETVGLPESGTQIISLEKEMDWEFQNGVFVFEWMNVKTEPWELNVYGPDGTKLLFLEEYSEKGHYVYEIGTMAQGIYIVDGITGEPLTGVMMSLYEKEDYLGLFSMD